MQGWRCVVPLYCLSVVVKKNQQQTVSSALSRFQGSCRCVFIPQGLGEVFICCTLVTLLLPCWHISAEVLLEQCVQNFIRASCSHLVHTAKFY